jgi:RecA/RadA recombinase
MASKLEAALALAARGFKVFPLAHNAKSPPLVKDWPKHATADAESVKVWWALHGEANIGIHCDGFIVIDVDVKKGGNDSLAFLEMTYGLPETLTTITPSGGRHLFFRHPLPVSNSVEMLGAGLDVRSSGGYVVGPGSEVSGGRYKFQGDCAVADAPDWLVLKLGTIVPKTGTTDLNVPDAPDDVVARAAEWLKTAERSVKGQGGDQAAYRVACQLRDFGISYLQACDLMRSDAWDLGCGWREGRLEDKPIRSAYRYAQNDPGSAIAKAEDFPIVQTAASKEDFSDGGYTEAAGDRAEAGEEGFYSIDDVEKRSDGRAEYLVKGLLYRRSYVNLYGAPGEGKTFVALDLCYHVAASREWFGRKVRGGAVIYVPFEGRGGLMDRLSALRKKYGYGHVPFFIAENPTFNMRAADGRKTFGRLLSRLPAGKPSLIVIDTFAYALSGGDENSAQDVSAFNQAVQCLIESTGACVMVIHHTGKNKSAGARGSSALNAAVDAEIFVDDKKVTVTKQREDALADAIGFQLKKVVVRLDEDNEEVTSCVVEPDAVTTRPHGKITGNAKRGFEVLCDLRPDNAPLADHEWREACGAFLGGKNVAQRFYDIKRVLRTKGYIVIDEQGRVTRRCE